MSVEEDIYITLVEEAPIIVQIEETILTATIEEAQPITIEIQGYNIVKEADVKLAVEEIIVELLYTEDITEQIDGVKTEFVSTISFYAGTLKVWINGLKERGVVEIDSNTFSLIPAPSLDDMIEIEYLKKE